MVVDEYVYLKINLNKILKYYIDLGYKAKLRESFKVKVSDLRPIEKVIVNCKCDKCGNVVERSYIKYLSNKNKYYFGCSDKCIRDKAKLTMLKKYGVEHAAQSKEFRDKAKITMLDKYGVESPLQSKEIKEKAKSSMIEKYGVENIMYLDSTKEKIEKTNLERYGTKSPLQNKEVYSKLISTNLERYGVECTLQNEDVKEKIKKTSLEKYGHINAAHGKEAIKKIKETCLKKYGSESYGKSNQLILDNIKKKKNKFIKIFGILEKNIIDIDIKNITIYCENCKNNYTADAHFLDKRIKNGMEPCINCFPINHPSSINENALSEFIKESYIDTIIENDRKILEGKELDVYLPELNLAFEFNGVYWHSEIYKDKTYHLNKTNDCLDKNIHLIHVYEDDWNYKQDIVKSRILNLLGKSKRVYARKCIIKEVDSKRSKQFLIDNHIQGNVNSKIILGLYYENELISLMSFGGLRKNLGQVPKDGHFELLRFCNKLNTTVIGGASRLFKNFVKTYNPIEVISYADRSWSKGGLYENLGFEKIKNTDVNYQYVINGIRENRYKYRKDVLVKEGYDINMTAKDIMFNRNIYRIYDSGSIKFKYKK